MELTPQPTPYHRDLAVRRKAAGKLFARTLLVWTAVAAALLLAQKLGPPPSEPESTAAAFGFAMGSFLLMLALLASLRAPRTVWGRTEGEPAPASFQRVMDAIGFLLLGFFALVAVGWALSEPLRWYGLASLVVVLVPGPMGARSVAAVQWVFGVGYVSWLWSGPLPAEPLFFAVMLLLPLLFVTGLLAPPWPSWREMTQRIRGARTDERDDLPDLPSAASPGHVEVRRLGHRLRSWVYVVLVFVVAGLLSPIALLVVTGPTAYSLAFPVMRTEVYRDRIILSVRWGEQRTRAIARDRIRSAKEIRLPRRQGVDAWNPGTARWRRSDVWGRRFVRLLLDEGEEVLIGSQRPERLVAALRGGTKQGAHPVTTGA